MALPTPLTSAQVGGAGDVNEVRAAFAVGPHTGLTLLVSKTDPNLAGAIASGEVVVEDAGEFPPPPPAPVNTVPPVITGTTQSGQTLTVSNGTWTGSPTFTRQWLANGSVIPSATGSTYVPTVINEGATISCRVTGTNAGGNSVAVAAGVGPITAP